VPSVRAHPPRRPTAPYRDSEAPDKMEALNVARLVKCAICQYPTHSLQRRRRDIVEYDRDIRNIYATHCQELLRLDRPFCCRLAAQTSRAQIDRRSPRPWLRECQSTSPAAIARVRVLSHPPKGPPQCIGAAPSAGRSGESVPALQQQRHTEADHDQKPMRQRSGSR